MNQTELTFGIIPEPDWRKVRYSCKHKECTAKKSVVWIEEESVWACHECGWIDPKRGRGGKTIMGYDPDAPHVPMSTTNRIYRKGIIYRAQ